MQLKYPELLYALFLLLIPILIHLFQLRKFEKVAFTNVKFLKKIELQTRKSSKLKQFLVLLSRLLLFAFIILAFAQPFYNNSKIQKEIQTILYLDNSLSMQAKSGNIPLLEKAKQDIIQSFANSKEQISILTNDSFFADLSGKELKNTVLSVDYFPISKKWNTILKKATFLFKKNKNTIKNLVLISDFQNASFKDLDTSINYSLISVQPKNIINQSVDSMFLVNRNMNKLQIKTILKSNNLTEKNLSVSLYDNNKLLGKSNVSFTDKKEQSTLFETPFSGSLHGKIILDDKQLVYDNTLYFCLNKPKKINVLVIGEDTKYASNIYTDTAFNLSIVNENQIDFNNINKQNTIILNELSTINNALQEVLNDFVKKGGSLVIIPSVNSNIDNYNLLFNRLKLGKIISKEEKTHQINTIVFEHPILQSVFEKKVTNFQFPTTQSNFIANLNHASGILKYENEQNFISQIKHGNGLVYWFSGAINTKNSSFKNAPLIVPVFYNIASQSYKLQKAYYVIGEKNELDVLTKIGKDQILKIQEKDNPKNSFIPLQQIFQDKIRIDFQNTPLKAGFYQVINNDQVILNIAFNYNRQESDLNYTDITKTIQSQTNVSVFKSVQESVQFFAEKNQSKPYWKWFVLIAGFFLLLEMALIKFWK